MKKILFLITTLGKGGAEKVISDLVNMLPCDKYEITLQTIYDQGAYKSNIAKHINYKSIVKTNNRIVKKIFRILMKYFPQFIYRMFIKDTYDIEVAFLEGMPTKLIAYSTEQKSRKIAWIHTDLTKYFDSINDYTSFSENLKAYLKFDKIACVSNNVKESYIERFNDVRTCVEVIYNVFEDDTICKLSEEIVEERPKEKLLFISCGRLCEQKGYLRLLEIHKQLIDEGLVHELWLIGDGPERPLIEKFIEEQNIDGTVKLLGFKDNPYKYMRIADLFICSSLAEGYSTVVTEATIVGLPVFSVDVAGAYEPLDCIRCNVIVDNEYSAIYSGLKKILENPILIKEYKEEQEKKKGYFKREKMLEKVIDFLCAN